MLPSDKIRARLVRRQFKESLSVGEFDLVRSALLVAAVEQPNVNPGEYLEIVRDWGETVVERAESRREPRLQVLLRFVHQEMGLRGNELAYYDPENSFLNRVLDRGLGIPISLATVLISVGRHAGLQVNGVGMPGHFLVNVIEPGHADAVLIDPFRGERINRADCQRKLDELFDGRLELLDEHLSTVSDRQILERMLRNLKAVYLRYGLNRRALSVAERILLVVPGSLSDIRDRGVLRVKLNDYAGAIADLEQCISSSADGPETAEVAEQIKAAKIGMAKLN